MRNLLPTRSEGGCLHTVSSQIKSPHYVYGMQVVDWNQLADDGGQHYIVIASDGLWEFVPNQEVMETVAQGGSLSAICQKLAVEARRRWRNFDPTHIDDTTLTLIKLHVAPLGQGYNLLL